MPIELEKFGDVGTAALGGLAEQGCAQIATLQLPKFFLTPQSRRTIAKADGNQAHNFAHRLSH
jgi:hypothetical protein